MPFQSSKSLKAARALKNRLTRNRTKNQSMGRRSAAGRGVARARLAARGAGELQDGLVGPDVAELLAGELLDVGRIAAQALRRAREPAGRPAQRAGGARPPPAP